MKLGPVLIDEVEYKTYYSKSIYMQVREQSS